MDIELARTFLAVVETGSFFDAAEKVHVTQSTVSMRIRSLEDQLGRPVFERGKSGATLTPAGHRFHRHAQALVRTWSQARLDASLPDVYDMSLEIGAVPSLWHKLLIDALPILRNAFPNVSISAVSERSETLSRQIADGSLDIAVTYRPLNTAELNAIQLFEDDFVLVSSNPDAQMDPLGDAYVLIDWGPEFRADHLLNFPHMAKPALQLGLGMLGLDYLRAVPGSGYFPYRVVSEEVERGKLRLVEDAPRFGYAAYAVTSEAEGIPAEAVRQLQKFAKARVQ
ncbi:LysR family transcriptional regulator [Roseovarius rhodophyticola]|uniref:LysR family transcriptional regulator n=1 Tax=Roseovarius rhodophyticola TaxID=3080827 RepID=A0ABZ2TER0_9RHOB|nr:LysR family transcriptional regulator [Roseovarius sp. W115]MDV2928426.1 LysR family transcriptional regulator [Roseovarius sp. W115]